MRPAVLALAALTALAGCATPDEPAPGTLADADGAIADDDGGLDPAVIAAAAPGANATATPAPEVVPVAWDGAVAAEVVACEGLAANCVGHEITPANPEDLLLDALVGKLVIGGNLTMTWTAANPTMERLGIGVMMMVPGCADCESWDLGWTEGTSPLATIVTAAPGPVPEGGVVHVYVYGFGQEAGPAFAYAGPEQPFRVDGSVLAATPI